jgi:transposase
MEDYIMPHFLGLDVAKDSFMAVLLDEDGQVVQGAAQFANNTDGFAELVEWLPDRMTTIGMCEPTGVYNQHLKHALASQLASLHELNAQTLRRSSFSQVRTKTDQADALMIAEATRMLYLGKREKLEKCRVSPSPQRENLTLWLSEYDRLRRAIAMLRQQIGQLDHHAARDARKVQRRREQELRRLCHQQAEVTEQIEQAYQQLDDAQARLIDSIPGLGTIATATTLVVVRDLERFRSADALKAYLGIYPRRNQSGLREKPAHMAHHGNALMRHVLWNAARAAVRVKHPANPFRELHDRLRKKGKGYAYAIGAVCRKLVQVIYGVLKSQTPFKFASDA